MYKEVVFYGKYIIKKNSRGVQRYSREVLNALDKIIEPKQFKVIIPYTEAKIDLFQNLEIVKYGGKHTFFLWQFFSFQWYLLSHKALAICLSDGLPFFNLGIYALHDVRFLLDARKKCKYGLKIHVLYERFISWWGVHNAKRIVTVSEFSKNEIIHEYGIDADKISVCYNSWQHFNKVRTDESFFENNSQIKKNNYYFILGGKADNKNIRWVTEVAKRYPERKFVFAGPPNTTAIVDEIHIKELSNCIYLGYISDEQVKVLYTYCKAFLFPSKYEGFGIPPLEALSCGAKVFMSNAACLPEIYQDYVSYFDPYDYNVDLDKLEQEEHPNSKDLLQMYSWEETAKKIYDLANTIIEKDNK